MRLRHAKTLITGKPGVGKTTLIRKIVERNQPVPVAGFYTSEIMSRGHRSGFELCGVNGERRSVAERIISKVKAFVDTFIDGVDLCGRRQNTTGLPVDE